MVNLLLPLVCVSVIGLLVIAALVLGLAVFALVVLFRSPKEKP